MTSPREKRQRLFKQLLSMQSDTFGGCDRSNDCRSMERNVGETGDVWAPAANRLAGR